MKVDVFFSLFSSPSKAYGSVTGTLDIDEPFELGKRVRVLQSAPDDWFDGVMDIEILTEVPVHHRPLVGLGAIVAQSEEDAARLGRRFETEAGLFSDPYD